MTVIKRALLLVFWLPYVLTMPVLLAMSPITWVLTGVCVHGQIDWWLDRGQDFFNWAVDKNA